MTIARVAAIGLAASSWLVMAACSDAVTPCTISLTCSYAGDGGGGGPVVPADCDLTKSPKDSSGCVTETVGIFVSPAGADTALGSKSAPVKTIGKALQLAAGQSLPRVYVCEGTYGDAAEITSPVSIYGGFSCAWAYTGAKPKLAPAKGIALKVTKVSGAVVVEDLEIVGSADPNTPGDSAIAAFLSESSATFRNTALTAAAGTAAIKGAGRSNYTDPSATAGGNANGTIAGLGAPCTCVDATSSKGGNGAGGTGVGLSDGSSVPPAGTSNGGQSGTTTCNDGQPGGNGAANIAGAPSTAAGLLSAAGWLDAPRASNAANGNPGQGGGGGGAKTNANSAGGGGACGGCGGAGGEPGFNGGSSFAVLSFNSTTKIEGGTLVTSAGGRGGDGAGGQSAQAGGAVGAGACNGGAGGNGAGGSGGGGGAGGYSVPIAFVGTEPAVSGATLTPGTAGEGGAGGQGGSSAGAAGAKGSPGPIGKSQPTLGL